MTGLRVALSGLGGDELLGGYPSFNQIPTLVRNAKPFLSIPGLGRAIRAVAAPFLKSRTSPKYASLLEYGGSYGGAYLLRKGLFMPWELPAFLDGELVREGWETLQPILRLDRWVEPVRTPHAKVAAMEMSIFMREMLLRDADWASMAHSLEIRVPLVDIGLFNAVAPHLVSERPPCKSDIGYAPAEPLPEFLINRPKTGFFIPVREWLESSGEGSGQRGLRGWSMRVNDLTRSGLSAG